MRVLNNHKVGMGNDLLQKAKSNEDPKPNLDDSLPFERRRGQEISIGDLYDKKMSEDEESKSSIKKRTEHTFGAGAESSHERMNKDIEITEGDEVSAGLSPDLTESRPKIEVAQSSNLKVESNLDTSKISREFSFNKQL